MPRQPLCEVFGFPINNFDPEAVHYRTEKLCPFNNRIPQCTKDKAKDPLGVCSIKEGELAIVICPVRFRQSWKIIADVQSFLIPNAAKSDFVTEVRLKDANGQAIGNIDVVLVETDQREVIDFGALEIQAVYISGNVRNPFRSYIERPEYRYSQEWTGENYPSPDWLSSIKRLEHQLTAKGTILNSWGKKMAVAVQNQFYNNFRVLHGISEVPKSQADIGWFL